MYHWARASVLLLTVLSAGAVAGTYSEESASWILACRADNDLFQVLQDASASCQRCDTPSEAIRAARPGGAVLLLADGYPAQRTSLAESDFEVAARKRLRLYIEYPASLPDLELGVPRYQRTGHYGSVVERTVLASDFFEPDLARMRIVMVHDCHYLPVDIPQAHLVLTQVEGYDHAVYGITEAAHPLLFEHAAGNTLVATTKLSQFVTGRYAPTEAWAPIWQRILAWLAPGETVPALTWTPVVRPMYARDESLPADALDRAIRRGVDYYRKSRLLVHADWPPQEGQAGIAADWPLGDGSLGIGECYISKRIFIDGSQAVSRSVRTDCNLEAALGLACGFALDGQSSDATLAHTLNDLIFFDSPVCQVHRADPDNPAYGLLSYHTGDVTGGYWGDDNARALLSAIGSAALLKSDRWDESILRGILANFRTTGVSGFRPQLIDDGTLQQQGWRHFFNLEYVDYCPHMQAYLWTTYFWLYDKTGFQPLLERGKTGARMMMEAYPNWRLEANRYEQERCRMLLPLAWLVRADDTPEHRAYLDTVAQYVIDHQDPSGAIGQIPGHVVGTNGGYGTGECAIVHQAGDPATDALYSINFAFIGMHEAAAATGNPAYAASAGKMADFFVRTQTQSRTRPELDGTWYRGFDFRKWDYWGSDGDWGWGIWTNEIGWTHSWITATLALRRMNSSLWEISRHSRIARHFEQYRKIMLPD
jgi:hypothetical protein